ncbi:transcriptional regulator, AsnC family [Rhodoferax ferrireducens T118]|uniref:Transcriptional regulator, AsnC family n=1 Tax=Albidiferax ferrireducens (strain ATCC BAA-621 / DSM 15236 / T118) TaxID=338969 RepID=Q21ZI1_ALBFT|nr:Lrp/AsnC family transcriptional regulator [Rhodoferax ferrireducens]ABD68822.1 transcriptional regulator, AsnC family [Rhodoferax ferrireducens T118]WPC68029.1 Lrp/AsnC family transcriptional regulator [Rhodoferax ferrireducens]
MEHANLDSIDLQLLAQLQIDASLTNQDLAARVHVSPPTCLRRVKRLRDAGLIERVIAVLSVDKLADVAGFGLCALTEITLDHQDNQALEAFEQRVSLEDAVQQCYRVSPGPDFCLVVQVAQMPDYLALAQRLFTADANVRNVKTFFSVKRSKFGARVALPL